MTNNGDHENCTPANNANVTGNLNIELSPNSGAPNDVGTVIQNLVVDVTTLNNVSILNYTIVIFTYELIMSVGYYNPITVILYECKGYSAFV